MGDAGHVFEELGDLTGFPGELGFVGEVLVLAAAAFSEEGTGGGGALWGRHEDFEEVGARVVFVVAEDADADLFSGESERDEDDPISGQRRVFDIWHGDAGDAVAEVGEGVDGDFEFLVILEGLGVKLFRRSRHGMGLGEGGEIGSLEMGVRIRFGGGS